MIPLILSNSSISVYLRCHYQWFLSEVWRLPSEPSVPMWLGTVVHSAVERLQKTRNLVEASEHLLERFATEPWPSAADEDKHVVEQDAVSMLLTYHEEVFPAFTPKLVEAPFVIDIDGVAFSGIIDAADDDLRDLKTTSGKTVAGRKPSFRPADHRAQLTGYRFGYKFLTGSWPKRLLLDVLKRTGKYQQYEVEPDEREFRDVLTLTSHAIMSEDFRPTGAESGKCDRCPFSRRCQYSTVEKV